MYVPHSHALNKAYNLNSLESGAIYCLSGFLYLIAFPFEGYFGNSVFFPLFWYLISHSQLARYSAQQWRK
jgi:hypothetical protein